MTKDFIETELEDVIKMIKTYKNVELQTCLIAQVRFRIVQTRFKTLDLLLQFPQTYPHSLILMEIKSKTLPQKITDLIVEIFDSTMKCLANGEPQVLRVLNFVLDYLDTNPLCICADEISRAKQLFNLTEGSDDFFKVKQKKMQVHFASTSHNYKIQARITIPEVYPDEKVSPEIDYDFTNFPEIFIKFLEGQAHEIARRCIEPPLATRKDMKRPEGHHGRYYEEWKASPSLYPVVEFLATCAKRYPTEKCGLCKTRCFDPEPPGSLTQQLADRKVKKPTKFFDIERIYCWHIFHFSCLNKYMNSPPFKGKCCPECQVPIFHEKWKETEKTREERWAHHQAKQRELEEVTDFLK